MNKKTALAAPKRLSLSDATIQTYPLPAKGTVRVSDTECRGLAIRITSKGVKTFTVRHQRAGKRVLTSIGTYPSMSVHEARIKATELVSGAPAGPSNRKVSDLFENIYWPMREQEVRESTAYNSMCQYKLRIKGHIGHLPVSDIAKRDIVAMQDAWRGEMKSIAVPQMVISHFFNWLMEREYIAVSPVPRTKITRKPRERVMMLSELRELWRWADSFGDGLFADMNATMKLWLLTGLRRREVTGSEWSEFPRSIRQDFLPAGANTDEEEVPVWRIPADRMKGKREHIVPVGRPVADILQTLPNARTSERWVFPNSRGDAPTERGWQLLIKEAPVKDIVIHDIRRSVATQWANRLQVSDDVIGLSLAHSAKTVTASVYQRSLRLKERAVIQQRWHDLLAE